VTAIFTGVRGLGHVHRNPGNPGLGCVDKTQCSTGYALVVLTVVMLFHCVSFSDIAVIPYSEQLEESR
jgi:hypothetical protein